MSASARDTTADRTVDEAEVERFQRIAKAWWDPKSMFRPLHQIGPARLAFIREEMGLHFGLPAGSATPYKGLSILDVGCGGGLISEPLCRLGGAVTGIDPGARNVEIAKGHAEPQGLRIDYRVATVEELAAKGETFDAVACLEVVEHVPNVAAFVSALAQVVKPGGLLILSTINRNLKSFALAIVAAEYVLRWLPRGTHQWDRFITPDELKAHAAAAGLHEARFKGFVYNPLKDTWSLADDTSVNYLMSCRKPRG